MAKEKSLVDRIYDFLCSIKLSIFVLVALAVTSIIGTVLQQGATQAEYIRDYGEGMANIISLFNLGDMYHSWWFNVLIALLLVNITFCSIRRMPSALKQMKDNDPLFDKRTVALHEKWEISTKESADSVAEKTSSILGSKVGKVVSAEEDGARYFMASKGAYSRMGVYVTHFSLFLFAIGAIVGIALGFKGFVGIVEGTAEDTIRIRSVPAIEVVEKVNVNSKAELEQAGRSIAAKFANALYEKDVMTSEFTFSITAADGTVSSRQGSFGNNTFEAAPFINSIPGLVAQLNYNGQTPVESVSIYSDSFFRKLDFTVGCSEFVLDKYPDGRTKDYISTLSVMKNGRTEYSRRVEVNSPLIHDGIYFYQSSYGVVGVKSAVFTVADQSRRPLVDKQNLNYGETMRLPDGGVLSMRNIVRDDRGGPTALYLAYSGNDQTAVERVFEADAFGGRYTWWKVGPYLVKMDSANWAYYTGLQVAKDPGVPIVWAGCILITIGLLISFFVSHRRIWAKVYEEDGKTVLKIVGNASRNRVSFEHWFGDLVETVEEDFKK